MRVLVIALVFFMTVSLAFSDEKKISLVGQWEVSAYCNGTKHTSSIDVKSHHANGSFDGIFLGPVPHTGTFKGNLNNKKFKFIRNIDGRQQDWSGTLKQKGNQLTVEGKLKDPTHSPCDFELRKKESAFNTVGKNTKQGPHLTKDIPLSIGPIYWCLSCPRGHEPRLDIGFMVPEGIRTIHALVRNGIDNLGGDLAMEVTVTAPGGKVILSTKARSGSWEEFTCKAPFPGEYYIMLRDLDTDTHGKSPGNGGSLKILLK